jgi:hypothetical protein
MSPTTKRTEYELKRKQCKTRRALRLGEDRNENESGRRRRRRRRRRGTVPVRVDVCSRAVVELQ